VGRTRLCDHFSAAKPLRKLRDVLARPRPPTQVLARDFWVSGRGARNASRSSQPHSQRCRVPLGGAWRRAACQDLGDGAAWAAAFPTRASVVQIALAEANRGLCGSAARSRYNSPGERQCSRQKHVARPQVAGAVARLVGGRSAGPRSTAARPVSARRGSRSHRSRLRRLRRCLCRRRIGPHRISGTRPLRPRSNSSPKRRRSRTPQGSAHPSSGHRR